MTQTQFNLEVAGSSYQLTGQKSGVYCSTGRITFAILTVCVLIAATALLVFYLPDRTVKLVVTVTPSIQDPTTATATFQPPTTTTTRPPSVSPPNLLKGRLPKTVLPRRYELIIRPFLYDEDVPDSKLGERFTFDGWVWIKVECVEATDEITLHSKNITIHGMPTVHSVSRLDKTDIFESYKMIEEYAFLVLKLKEKLRPHEEYEIYITYSGIMANDLFGFYPSKYITSLNETRYIATTQMQGTYARRVLPCFDEPAFKASFDVQLEHRTDMSALSNGIDTRRLQLDSHWSRTYFKRVHSLPTYLLAFIVHDYSSINVTNAHGCLIRVWCETELIDFAPYALNISDEVQTFFDDYWDIEYPLEKQDHIAVQAFLSGAMENWGLIVYQDYYLLNRIDGYFPKFCPVLITHEIAHTWFGNLVTMEWWDDLWLNEGFAIYMEHIGVNLVHPEFKMYESFYYDIATYGLEADSLGVAPAIRAPVYASEEQIKGLFTPITYEKAGSIILMMEHFLTLDVFNQGIRNYLKERANKNANAEHLWEELTYADRDVGKHNVKKIMDAWTLQPGYPLITLTRTGQDVVATQKHFFQITDGETFEDHGNKWYVPLTYVYKSGPADQYDKPEQVWMEPTEQYTHFKLPDEAASDDWYLANANMVGFYRVNYEDDNWQRLLDQAATDPGVFSEENTVGLIVETFSLALAEVIPDWIHQNFSTYLLPVSPFTRSAVVSTSSYFVKMLLRSERGPSSSIRTYMQRIVQPLYDETGWEESSMSDAPVTRLGRGSKSQVDITSTACLYGNIRCVAKAITLFKRLMENPDSNRLSPKLRSAVYCSGIRFGGQSEWDFGWEMMQTTNDRQERSRWMSALTCSRDSSRVQSYLESLLGTTTFSPGDTEVILMGVAKNPDRYEDAWDFIRDNWEEVYTMFRGNRLPRLSDIFEEITSYFNTHEELQELLEFGENHHLGGLQYAYKSAIVTTKVNIRWMANSAEQTEQWMASLI